MKDLDDVRGALAKESRKMRNASVFAVVPGKGGGERASPMTAIVKCRKHNESKNKGGHHKRITFSVKREAGKFV